MSANNTNSREKDDLQRFYQAMAILHQKIDTLLKNHPDLLQIIDLEQIPAEKREFVEEQLWDIFVYGEYYGKKTISNWSEYPIVPASENGKAHFDYHEKEYKPFIVKLKTLIEVSKAPTRELVEREVINEADPYLFSCPRNPPEITETEIADYIALDVYEEFASASDGSLQEFIRKYIANHVEGHTSDSDGNIRIQTLFYRMLEVVKGYQSNIQFAGGPAINESTILGDGPRAGKTMKEEDENERLAFDLQVSDYEKIIDKPYFKPDDWVANEKELSPIIVDRKLKEIPARILDRIHEIHRSFIFGHWMSVIALSRCLLEYAIIDRNPSMLQLELYKDEDKKWRKPLAELVDDAKKAFPEMEKGERIIEAGNRVMHPSPHGTLSKFPPGKADAKDCIDGISTIISTLYSKPNNAGNPRTKPTTNTR